MSESKITLERNAAKNAANAEIAPTHGHKNQRGAGKATKRIVTTTCKSSRKYLERSRCDEV